jgi:SNF2 family DNA or RNA helicase
MSLRPYQSQVVDFAHDHGNRWLYCDAAGSGKTPTTVTWLAELHPRTALVLAPNAVCGQWMATIAQWTHLAPIDLRGAPAARRGALERLHAHGGVGVVNYELLRKDDALTRYPWDAVAIDEAHRLKSRTNQVGTAGARFAKVPAIALLSGTPMLNAPEEVWMMLHMARPKQYTSYWRWVRTHFYTEITDFHGTLPRAVELVLGLRPGEDDVVRAQLAEVMIARSIDQLLPGLPPVTPHLVPVQLSDAEREAYDKMADKGWMHVGDELVETTNSVSRMIRLRQMANEWSVFSDKVGIGTKTAQTIELLTGASEQAVVLTGYKASVDAIAREVHGVRFTGDESHKQRRINVEKFKSGEAQFIVGTIAAMGEGLDGLQVARSMVRLDRDWSPARNEQVIARLRRSGQTADAIHVVDIFADDTVDEDVALTLAHKTGTIAKVSL